MPTLRRSPRLARAAAPDAVAFAGVAVFVRTAAVPALVDALAIVQASDQLYGRGARVFEVR